MDLPIISIRKETKNALARLGKFGQSFDSLLTELIKKESKSSKTNSDIHHGVIDNE